MDMDMESDEDVMDLDVSGELTEDLSVSTTSTVV